MGRTPAELGKASNIPNLNDLYWIKGSMFMQDHLEIPIVCTVIYLLVVFGGQAFMKNRDPFSVRPLSIFWNGILAIFSIIGFKLFSLDLFLPHILEKGISHDLCSNELEFSTPWLFLFALSKIPELFDTFIHVVKKQKIIFLHWYHHVTVMWFCWLGMSHFLENGGAFTAMNLGVHALMYTYYTLVATGLRFPNLIRSFITMLQLVQMVLGTAFVAHNWFLCNYNPYLQLAGLVMYGSYFVLFAQFFYAQYCVPKPKAAAYSEKKTK